MKRLNLTEKQYMKIRCLLYDNGFFIDGLSDIDCPDGCMGGFVLFGEDETIDAIQELVRE